MDLLHAKNPELAQAVMPYLDEYMTSRANINRDTLLPAHFTGLSGTIPYPDPDRTETLIDHREAFFSDPETVETYERWGIPFPSEEEISTLPRDPQTSAAPTNSNETSDTHCSDGEQIEPTDSGQQSNQPTELPDDRDTRFNDPGIDPTGKKCATFAQKPNGPIKHKALKNNKLKKNHARSKKFAQRAQKCRG
jgi:hypothetical protein